MKRILAVIGLTLLILPLLTMAGTFVEFLDYYSGKQEPEEGDAVKLVYQYSGGSFIGMIAIIWMGFVVDGFEYRERWLFRVLLCLGVLWLLYFPLGTLVGLALIIYTFGNRKKFLNTTSEPVVAHNSE